jgi:hypothetical protein
VNLVIDGPEHYRRVGVNIEADALCNKCLGHLGFKYVKISLFNFDLFRFLSDYSTRSSPILNVQVEDDREEPRIVLRM